MALAAAALSPPASAEKVVLEEEGAKDDSKGDSKKVILGKVSGPKGGGVRKWVIQALEKEDSIELVTEGDGDSLEKGEDAEKYAEVAEAEEAHAVVSGRVNLKKVVGWSLDLWVYNGKDGELIEEVHIKGGLLPKLKQNVLSQTAEKLAGPLAEAEGHEPEPPPPEEPEEVEEEPEEEPDEEEEEPDEEEKPRPSPLELAAGLRIYARSFEYTDTLAQLFPDAGNPVLLTYELGGAPMLMVSGTWYPVAHFTGGTFAHFGVHGRFEQGFATNTAIEGQDETLGTSHNLFAVGPKVRLPVGQSEFGLMVLFGSHTFEVTGQPDPPLVPNVKYNFIDAGADARIGLGSFDLGAHAQYRIVTSTGDLQSDRWFPNAKGSGVFAGLFGAFPITELLEIQAGGDLLQYGFDFNPIPDTAPPDRVAGGATDRYISGWVALGLRLPGDEEGKPPAKGDD